METLKGICLGAILLGLLPTSVAAQEGIFTMQTPEDRLFWTAAAAQVGFGLFDAWGQTILILDAKKGTELVPTTAANIDRFGLRGAMWTKTAMHVGWVAGAVVIRARFPRTRWGTAWGMLTMAAVNGAVVVWNEQQLRKAGLR